MNPRVSDRQSGRNARKEPKAILIIVPLTNIHWPCQFLDQQPVGLPEDSSLAAEIYGIRRVKM